MNQMLYDLEVWSNSSVTFNVEQNALNRHHLERVTFEGAKKKGSVTTCILIGFQFDSWPP